MNSEEMRHRVDLLRTLARNREYKTELTRDSDSVLREGILLDIVERYEAEARFEGLIGMAGNQTYTVKVREAAGRGLIRGYLEKGWYGTLLKKVATNKKLPWRIRKEAGEEAVEAYAMKGWYTTLYEISNNRGLLGNVRELAKSHIELREEELGVKGGFVSREELIEKHKEAISRGVFSRRMKGDFPAPRKQKNKN